VKARVVKQGGVYSGSVFHLHLQGIQIIRMEREKVLLTVPWPRPEMPADLLPIHIPTLIPLISPKTFVNNEFDTHCHTSELQTAETQPQNLIVRMNSLQAHLPHTTDTRVDSLTNVAQMESLGVDSGINEMTGSCHRISRRYMMSMAKGKVIRHA
jgi:hypothetical protein